MAERCSESLSAIEQFCTIGAKKPSKKVTTNYISLKLEKINFHMRQLGNCDVKQYSPSIRIMAEENSLNVTQVIHISSKKLKFDCNGKLGKSEFLKVYRGMSVESRVNIKLIYTIDESLIFLVTGKHNDVLETRRDILMAFQTQTRKEIHIPKEHHRLILGTQGQRWKELERATATKIQIPPINDPSDIISITGTEEDIQKAELAIETLSDERANIVTTEVSIPFEQCDSLKRTGRKLIQSIIADCGSITIIFPTAESNSDKVIIKGPKDNVEKAKQQLLELANEKLLSSFSAEVRAKPQHHKFLIGKIGANIEKITEFTGVRIISPTEQDKDKEVITITEKQDAVDKAKALLESTVEKIVPSQFPSTSDENRTESDMSIESKYHGHFLARRGEVLHRIIEECGEVQISFPRTSAEGDRVVIKGTLASVRAAKERLMDIVHDLESMVTIECDIPRKYRPAVIGTKGYKVRGIMAEFNVQIRFPDRFTPEEQRSDKQDTDEERDAVEIVPDYDVVRITGQPDKAEAAKQALLGLVPISIKLDIPNDLHGLIIGQRGRDVRELMEKYDVQITLSRPERKIDYVTITGIPLRVDEAKEVILERCRKVEAERQERALKSYELKIKVDSEYHPKIIGRAGAVVKKIISDNDVVISFPRIGESEDNVITITGYEKNVHDARDDVIKIIYELDQRQTMVFGQLHETQHKEDSSCERSTPTIHADIIDNEATEVQKDSQDLSNIHEKFTNAKNDIKTESPTEEVDQLQTQMQKLFEKLNISCNSMSLIREHTDIVTDALKYCKDSQKRLTALHNNEIRKQESRMKELKDQLDDQVSTNEALRVGRAQLVLEIDNVREECAKIINETLEKYNEETTKLSDTVKDIESKLNAEQEEKSKLVTENNENSKRLEELSSKHQALHATTADHEKVIESLKSSMEKLATEKSRVNKELDELKRARHAAFVNENFNLAEYRKQLQDLTLAHAKSTSKLKELVSVNEKLSDTVTQKVQDISLLKTAAETKDDMISKLNIDLNNTSENNKDLSDIIGSLSAELVLKEEELRQVQKDFETYKANVDENVLREKANHEAKLNKIKSNVFDLREKLVEISQNIQNSSEICEMLNEAKNTSGAQSDNAES